VGRAESGADVFVARFARTDERITRELAQRICQSEFASYAFA
jgi:hypothetical protein